MRIGTCKFCAATPEMWIIGTQPHQNKETHIVMPEGVYTCQ